MKTITTKAPGKLMLAGEWSVLETGNSCIVLPINKFVTVTATSSDTTTISDPTLNIENKELNHHNKKNFTLTQKTIETVSDYLKEKNIPFQTVAITVDPSALYLGNTIKIGLGSSAAIVVALTKALLKFHDQDTISEKAKDCIFKLACIAHYKAQGNIGSGFDIAASTYQKPLNYKCFDASWLMQKMLNKKQSLQALIDQPWPHLHIEPIRLPKNFILNVCFSGYSSSTKELISCMRIFKEKNNKQYQNIYSAINDIVLKLLEAIKNNSEDLNNKLLIIKLLDQNKDLLKILSKESNCNLETSELKKIIEIAQQVDVASKFSGAGGGDCGIAVCFDQQTAKNINNSWIENGFKSLEISVLR